MNRNSIIAAVIAIPAVIFVGIQFVPLGVELNPPVTKSVEWDSQQTADLALAAGCMDCHSNETKWPWYSRIAPVSWYVAGHVKDGRRKLNFSEMEEAPWDPEEAGEEVREGHMPPSYYPPMHPEAKLTDQQRNDLADGLDKTLGGGNDDNIY